MSNFWDLGLIQAAAPYGLVTGAVMVGAGAVARNATTAYAVIPSCCVMGVAAVILGGIYAKASAVDKQRQEKLKQGNNAADDSVESFKREIPYTVCFHGVVGVTAIAVASVTLTLIAMG